MANNISRLTVSNPNLFKVKSSEAQADETPVDISGTEEQIAKAQELINELLEDSSYQRKPRDGGFGGGNRDGGFSGNSGFGNSRHNDNDSFHGSKREEKTGMRNLTLYYRSHFLACPRLCAAVDSNA